jgi:aminoglycoside 6-adenylyltransferase
MRSDRDIFTSLIEWAFEDENIRAIVVNGSRSDPTRVIDDLSDYDVAVFVREPDVYRDDQWLGRFGKVMVRWPLEPQQTLGPDTITQLVLFQDDVRIDFQFMSITTRQIERIGPFHCVLVDKERLSEYLAGTPINGTTIQLPSEAEFIDRINAFWWDLPYAAKALARGEVEYARFIMESELRFDKLHPLIQWHIALEHGSNIDTGIFGRWFKHYLPEELWSAYLETYSGMEREDQLRATFAMGRFVGQIGRAIADGLGVTYPVETERNVLDYMRWVETSARIRM